jgi:hypothetical protein
MTFPNIIQTNKAALTKNTAITTTTLRSITKHHGEVDVAVVATGLAVFKIDMRNIHLHHTARGVISHRRPNSMVNHRFAVAEVMEEIIHFIVEEPRDLHMECHHHGLLVVGEEVDAVVEIFRENTQEKIFRMTGDGGDDDHYLTFYDSAKLRIYKIILCCFVSIPFS